jgi:hypothetical protein
MRTVLLAAFAGAVGILAATQAVNATGVSCTQVTVRPIMPHCLENLERSIRDDFTFSRCFDALELYGQQVEAYAACSAPAGDRILRQYDSVVKEFNCFTNGEVCRTSPVLR